MRDGWTGRLWAEAAGTYAAILEHPFLAGLTDGRRSSHAPGVLENLGLGSVSPVAP